MNYVWDARFRGVDFDFTGSAYYGAQYRYEEIQIIGREKCDAELLKKFDRKRAGKIGRISLEEPVQASDIAVTNDDASEVDVLQITNQE